MRSQDQMMIDAQARHISDLRAQVKTAELMMNRLNNEVHKSRNPAAFYLALVRCIQEDELIAQEWGRFIMFLKLALPSEDTLREYADEEFRKLLNSSDKAPTIFGASF